MLEIIVTLNLSFASETRQLVGLMSKLKFDGAKHELVLLSEDDREIGRWVAYNNVDSHASLRFIPNGTYVMKDTARSHPPR